MLKIGIDISKLTIDCVSIIDKTQQYQQFDNNTSGFRLMLKWLKITKNNHQDSVFCMEATNTYHLPLAKFLFAAKLKVMVINPLKTYHFAKSYMARNKTDKVDAAMIANFCGHLEFEHKIKQNLWQPKTSEFEDLQYLIARLEQLEQHKSAERNRLDIAINKTIITSIKLAIRQIDKQIENLKSSIKTLITSHDTLKEKVGLLKTIGGIGDKSAWSFLAYAGDTNNFASAKHITSFAGLNPQKKQSGTSINSSSLAKMGHGKIRKTMFMPALVAIKHNPLLKAFYQKLLSKGKPKMLAIAAVMRKLLVICYGVLKSGKPFDANYAT